VGLAAEFLLLAATLLLAGPPNSASDISPVEGRWRTLNGRFFPDGRATWSVALEANALPADQFVQATVTVLETGTSAGEPWEDKPGIFGTVSRGDGLGISRDYHATFGADRSGENDQTGDAGLYLRYDATGALPNYYRVQIMARGTDCGEILIYTPAGGIVAAKPYPFTANAAIVLRAEAQGNTLTVKVNGKTELSWVDTNARRPLGGKAGIGALRAKVQFEAVSSGALEALVVRRPAAARNFKLRPWNAAHPHLWLFDGDEPVFQLYETRGAELRSAKLRPGHLPVLETIPLQVTQWVSDAGSLSDYVGMTEAKTGATWEGLFKVKAKAGDASAVIRIAIAYDAERDVYVYEYNPTVTCPAAWPVSADIEWLDLFPAAIMSSRIDATPTPRQRNTQWFAWEQPGGKQARKQSLTHHWRNLGVPEGRTSPLFTSHPENQDVATGGLAAWGVDEDQNIAVRVIQDAGVTSFVELCEWAFDVHWRLRTPGWRAGGVPAGTSFSLLARISSQPKETVRALVNGARHQLDGLVDNVVRPRFTWPTTTFDHVRPGFDPANNDAFFSGGLYDPAGGVGGSAAMKLDGSHRQLRVDSGTELGTAGYFPESVTRFGRRTLSFKARTDSGTGTLTLKVAQTAPRSQAQEKTFVVPSAWTTFSMDAEPLNAMHQGNIHFRHDGGGAVWIDDLTFSDVPPDAGPDRKVFEPEAYLSDGNAGYRVRDDAATNGYAVAFNTGNEKGGIFLNAYDTGLPAGEYEALVRCKVSDTGIAEGMGQVWISQRNIRGVGVAQPLSGAAGTIKGNMLDKPNVYQDLRFTFTRGAAGALDLHLEYLAGARRGTITIDHIALRRLKDAWGQPVVADKSK